MIMTPEKPLVIHLKVTFRSQDERTELISILDDFNMKYVIISESKKPKKKGVWEQ